MKRDDDLLRELLFEFEAEEDWLILLPETLGMSKDDRIRGGHVRLLADAGFVTKVGNGTYRLTNLGHDYLEAIRDDDVWNRTKDGAKKIGGATLGMMADIAVAYLKREAAAKLGIEL